MKKILLLTIVFLTILATSVDSFAQTLYWGGSGSAWNSSSWSTSDGGSYNSAWVNNSPVVFNVDGTIAAPTSASNFSSLNCNANVSFTSFSSTIGTSSTIATINVASGKTFDFGTQPISNTGGTGFIKNGLGTLVLSGATYGAGFTLNAGTVIARGINAFGNGILTINGGTIAGISSLQVFGTKHANIIIGGNFTLGVTTDGIASSSKDLTFGSTVDLGTANRTITLNGTGTNTFSGTISGGVDGGIELASSSTGTLVLSGANTYSGGVTVAGGTLVLSGANTYSGATTLSGGTLTLGAANVIPDASVGIIFNGGTLKTGAFDETYPPLYLDDNSTIILNATVQSHNFSASNSVGFATGKTLTITGWAGGYNSTSGTKGKIFIGTDATGLTASQLQQIKFFNGAINYDATILSTGEIVPSTISTLPISLTSFTAKPIDETILLNWATASEKNNQKFDVLKSADGKKFKSIATINGAGNSNSENSYSFVDENPYAGANYYQLKQTDLDGATATSTIISANAKIEGVKLSAYASTNSVTINVNSPNQTDGEIALFDMNGRKLDAKSLALNKGYNEVIFNKFLAPGTYFVNLISAGKSNSFKFIK